MHNAPFKFRSGRLVRLFFKRHGWQMKDVRYFTEERAPRAWYCRRPGIAPADGRLTTLVVAGAAQSDSRFAGYGLLERAAAR